MEMPMNIQLATSNISDKETNLNKTTEKEGCSSKKGFSSLLEKKLTKEGLEKVDEEDTKVKLGVKLEKKEIDLTDELSKKQVINIPFFTQKELKLDGSVAKEDFGNRIESSKIKLDSQPNLLTTFSDAEILKKSSKVEEGSKIPKEFHVVTDKEKLDPKKLSEIKNILDNKKESIDSTLELKKKLGKLYEVKEKEAVDTSLKVRDIANKSQITVTKERSPQSKGRIYIRNEEDFILKNAEGGNKLGFLEKVGVSESELRKVNDDLKMLGIGSYGFKKFKESEEKRNLDRVVTEFNQQKIGSNIFNNNQFSKVEQKNNQQSISNFSEVVEQVENGIKMHFNSQLKEMKIKLQPEELGEVDVKLKIENDIMKAEFIVESQQVKEILESKFDLLKNNLEAKGFQASEVSVFVSTGDRNNHKTNDSSDFFESRRKKVRDSVEGNNSMKTIEEQSARRRVEKNSSLDIFV